MGTVQRRREETPVGTFSRLMQACLFDEPLHMYPDDIAVPWRARVKQSVSKAFSAILPYTDRPDRIEFRRANIFLRSPRI